MLCMGTNNLTKKKQSEMDTAKEIIEVVKKCYDHGVNDVYVAGLSARPGFQEQINQINKILEHNATIHNYEFIDNSNISARHLQGDELHLNYDGEILLANNFLKSLNQHSVYDHFY